MQAKITLVDRHQLVHVLMMLLPLSWSRCWRTQQMELRAHPRHSSTCPRHDCEARARFSLSIEQNDQSTLRVNRDRQTADRARASRPAVKCSLFLMH